MNFSSNIFKKIKKTVSEISREIGQETSKKMASFKSYMEKRSGTQHVEQYAGGQNISLDTRDTRQSAVPGAQFALESDVAEISKNKIVNSKNNIASESVAVDIAHTETSSEAVERFVPKNQQVKVSKTVSSAPKRIYADYASLTPIDTRVKKVMIDAMDEFTANPSSIYSDGVKAKQALQDARTSISTFFGVQPAEIIFTSGGTESNNLALKGVLEACEKDIREDAAQTPEGETPANDMKPHIIISTVEHPSIVEIALDLISKGYNVSFVPVDEFGLVDPKDIKKALTPLTVLVSVMYANNEIGTVQPIKEIAREVRHYKKSLGRDNTDYPYMHTDACQAVLYEDMRIPGLGIDMMTIDGGKIYGPRGTGVLVKKNYVRLAPLFNGGSQEFGLRAGTENIASIVGIKHALDIVHNEKEEEYNRLKNLTSTLKDTIFTRLQDKVPGITLNGDKNARLPNNLNICFPGMDAEFIVIRLDVLGVMLSSVTSCRASNEDSSSYVIEALGKGGCSSSSLRITLGRNSTALDVAHIAERVIQVVEEQLLQQK